MEFSEIATVYYFEESSFWDETTCTFFVQFTPEGVEDENGVPSETNLLHLKATDLLKPCLPQDSFTFNLSKTED